MLFIILFFNFSYSHYTNTFEDNLKTNHETKLYFSSNYSEARSKFRKHITKLPAELVKTHEIFLTNPKEEDLTIDYKFFGKAKNKSLLILTSGVHGGEAYTGSAIQFLFMEKLLKPELLNKINVLIIHGVNPWGFKYFRRTTANNVDLNRNFSNSDELFQTKNYEYDELKKITQPELAISAGIYVKIKMFFNIIFELYKMGRRELSKALLQGQYVESKGLYFGGLKPEPETIEIKKLLEGYTKDYDNIVLIDLHTGFGEKGKLHLFGSSQISDINRDFENKIFEDLTIDTSDDEKFYETKGDLCQYIRLANPNKKVAAMTFEFGTLNSQTTLGGFNSIYNMITENQGFFWGYVSEKDKETIQNNFLEMFFPQNVDWRDQSLFQAEKYLKAVVNNLQKY